MTAAERLARKFHDTCERLAANRDYPTRPDSAVLPWENLSEANREIMIATSQEIIDWLFPIRCIDGGTE